LVLRLADYTRRLHSHRFVHHDYFWRNIILTGKDLTRFFLIDAHKGTPWRSWAEWPSRAKDLATLDAPAPRFYRQTERLRFFLRYSGHPSLTAEDKKLIRLVLKMAAPLRERQYRRVERARPIEE
jgi:tRNA A-37 threonylcarbamoyl transferase component Bud32